TFDAVRSEDVAHGAILPSRNNNWQVFLCCCYHPTLLWIFFIIGLHYFTQKKFVHILMREITFTFFFSIFPYLENVLLYSSECFFFRYTSISDTIETALQQIPFLLWAQVTIIGYTLIMRMSYQVHNIFF